MTEPRATLGELLGGSLSPGLAALSDDELAALVGAIESAKTGQRHALAQAIDDGLAIVPRVLRGTVRKALFG